MNNLPTIVLGGICLSGKSTLIEYLKGSGLSFDEVIEGDDLHSEESIHKMRFGNPLDEADRVVWKERICDKIQSKPAEVYRVITCSSLTKAFRDDLRAAGPVCFIFLVFSRESAEKRAIKRLKDTWLEIHEGRKPHFFQPAIYPSLLDGQYRDLEIPDNTEADAYVVDLDEFPSGEFGPIVEFSKIAPAILEWVKNSAF